MGEPIAFALKLSKEGYGSVNEILEWDSEMFLSALEYSKFSIEFEEAFIEINKDRK